MVVRDEVSMGEADILEGKIYSSLAEADWPEEARRSSSTVHSHCLPYSVTLSRLPCVWNICIAIQTQWSKFNTTYDYYND